MPYKDETIRKEFHKKYNAIHYANNKHKWKLTPLQKQKKSEYLKVYRKNNKRKLNFLNRLNQARKKQACPKWANLQKIKEIYVNCPEGYQVDHIIPITNKNVCGLHVENNLQYLTKLENMRKKNKFFLN